MNTKLSIVFLATVAVILCCHARVEAAAILAVPPPSFVTAHSSQVVARNYNGYAATAVAAPLVAAPVAPVAAPYAAAPIAAPFPAAPIAAAYPYAYDAPYIVA